MKKKSTYILALLLLLPFKSILSTASAQGWLWGKPGTITGCDAFPIATDLSGNVFCAGLRLPEFGIGNINFGSGVTSPASPGAYQSIWVKYNNSGTALWADGTLSGDTWINSIATDTAGNLIVFGSFNSATMQIGSFTLTNSYSAGTGQYFLAKVSPTGTVLWAIKDGNILSTDLTIFGPYILGAGGVGTDAAGNIYISGSFDEATMAIGSITLTNSGPAGTFDIFVAKYSPAGAVIWASSIGGNASDYSLGLTVSSTGNIYVCGGFSSASVTIGSTVISDPFTHPIAFIAKFSPAGAALWGQAAGGANGSFALALASDNTGNVYMTGGFNDAAISFGSTTLTRTYPASVPALAEFLVQYSPADLATWTKTIGSNSSTGGTWGWSIALASCGQVWVSGNYSNDVNIDGAILAVIPGFDPVFIAGYNLGGGVAGYSGLGSGGDDQNGIACDASGNVFLCSDYETIPFSVGPDALPTYISPESFYLAKYAIFANDTNYMHQDTSLCSSDSITLTAPVGYANYFWNDGSSAPTLNVGATGNYWVFCHTCEDTTLADTFHVTIALPGTTYNHKDTSVCVNIGAATLSGPAGYTTYNWSTGSSASSIIVSAAGTYYVQATLGCSMVIDTFHFTVTPDDSTSATTDTGVCSSIGSLMLTAPSGYGSYIWNTGSTAASVTVNSSGAYWVRAINNCSTLVDTTKVSFTPLPVVALGPDTTICSGHTITISSDQPAGAVYDWSNGSHASSINISTGGNYSLVVTLNGCSSKDSVQVSEMTIPVIDPGNDTAVCTQYKLSLPVNTNAIAYLWSDGSKGQSIEVKTTGIYWVTASNICGSTSDTVKVTVGICDIGLPTAFSPNGDGHNDILYVRGSGIKTLDLKIFNRFGQLIFETNDQANGWDGTYNGQQQPIEIYAYVLNATLIDGTSKVLKGNVTLLR